MWTHDHVHFRINAVQGGSQKEVKKLLPNPRPPSDQYRAFGTSHRPVRPSRCAVSSCSTESALRSTLNVDAKLGFQPPSTFLLPFRTQLHTTAPRREAGLASESQQALADNLPSLLQSQTEGSQLSGVKTNYYTIDAQSSTTKHAKRSGISKGAPQTPLVPRTGTEAPLPDITASKMLHTISSEGLSTPANQPTPLVLSKSVQDLLPILRAQNPHYITAHIHRFPYLLTAGDTLRLPFHMHGVEPGDIIRLNRASLLGSRDYTLKAGTTYTETYDGNSKGQLQYLDERLFECRARILGVDTGPMMVKEKTKRRNRRVKKAKSKHKYTVLKVMEVRIKDLDELKVGKGDLLLS